MKTADGIVVFTLDGLRFALDLWSVVRVDRSVEVTPLPKAPDIVFGLINVRGAIIPVVNVRKRFRLPERDITLTDQLIIANTRLRTMALVVDQVINILPASASTVVHADEVLPGMEYVKGIVKLADGIVLIHDLEKFLSIPEAEALEVSMRLLET